MKSPMVNGLEAGKRVRDAVFLVQSKEVRQKKTGEPYLSLSLVDRTGDIDAKMWDNVGAVMDTFDRDSFVKVSGETSIYQNRLQFTVHSLVPVDESSVDLADFLPASSRDPEEMFAELMAAIAQMKNRHLRELLEAILSDREIAEPYKKAPAAKGIHHAWLGGLIEHVLSLLTLAKVAAKHYPGIDEDLLVTGVILHDIGKISELSYHRSFGYTTDGQLLGHIQIALRMIGEKLAALPDFPAKLRNLMEHLILSHHGALEFGSPKVPVFPEALLLHHLDNLDSKMETMRASIERDRPTSSDWTGYNAALERSVLDKQKYLGDGPKPQPKPAPAAPPKAAPQRQSSLFGQALKSAYDGGKEK